ncbi:hemicentin-1-like [Colias croceus]|uniref:hemicentin-1-like n=1 Tax=Colias crocea TaxID=72248 RepID=UPI001E27CD9D|nr:hemicentin-1-like [Colias croceus]
MVLFLLTFFILFSNTSQFIVEKQNITRAKIIDKDDGKSSLVFVFDTTGSMHNDLRQLRAGAEMILKTALEESNVIADFVFVPFHDPAIGPATVTKDKEVFKAALQIVHVYGGGDCPEKSLGGLLLALNVSRPRSFVYVFTDATASDHRLVGKVLDAVQRKQSQVVFVLTGHCNDLTKPTFKVYEQIAAASSGQIFNLNKNNVHKVLDFVRTSIKGRSVNLASSINPPGYNYTQKIPVDKTVNEVTVSVSGAKPQIRVVNPNGEEITGPPQLVTTLDLSEIMIVKVLEPEPGNWSITVGSSASHSVRVLGTSDLSFSHGFAAQTPQSMKDTGYRPMKGTYNHMMITLSKPDAPVKVKYAEILNLEGKSLFEVPLLKKQDGVYLADAFLPPDELFYLSINGVDESGQDFRRVGTTAVQAKLPDAPYLVVPQRIQARTHEHIVLSCEVDSLVPVTVAWYKDSVSLRRGSSLQSTTLDHDISDVREAHAGSYTCVAGNAAGTTSAETVLEIIVDPPQISVLPANTSILIDEDLSITCSVFSEALLYGTKIIFNGTDEDSVLDFQLEPDLDGIYTFNKSIKNVSERDAGLYTCLARNRGGVTNTSTHIAVITHPHVQIIGPHTLTAHEHTDIQITCDTENALHTHWLDPNRNILDAVSVNGSYKSVFSVKDLKEDGTWTCVASRKNYTASDSIHIKLLIKPEVKIEGSRNITVLNGTTVLVTCIVRAKPEPKILWYRDNEKYLEQNMTTMLNNTYKSILTLDSNKEDINGTYFCSGENSEGTDKDNITVRVRRKMILLDGFTDQSVELYSKVELPCNIDSYPSPTISWYHNSTRITNSTKMADNSTIYIEMVDFDDLGMYSCVADNSYEVLVVNATLSVHDLAAPVISKETTKKISQEGNSTILTCSLLQGKPEPTITWQYKSHNSSEFSNLPSDVSIIDNKIMILNVSIDSEGIYRCVAENIIGRDEYYMELVVQYAPKLLYPEEKNDLQLKVGNYLKLSCNVTGSPKPVVVWTKNDQPIVYSRNIYLSEDNELLIANVSQYDTGIFSCKAVSTLGSVARNFTLNVYEAPTIHSTNNQELELLEGQLVELPCSARGVPTPTVWWQHNGNNITSRIYVDEYGIRFVANLTDFGNYSCIASNYHGTAIFNYTLYVWMPPSIVPPLEENKNVLEASNVTLSCDAIGFPIPDISWEFNGEMLTENATEISFNNIGNLYIQNVSSDKVGEYVCVAENIAGFDVKRFVLDTHEPPRIISNKLKEYIGIEGRDTAITLSCKATGKPRPYVVWMKDKYYLDRDSRYNIDSEGSLTINLPSAEMSGNYTCIARNYLGNVTENVKVNIYPLPIAQSDEALTKVTLEEGKYAKVECPVKHAEEIKWYKDGTLISTGFLKFPNVSRSQSGTYSCMVSNTVGSAHSSVSVDVAWAPRFHANPGKHVEETKGWDWYFDCEVDAKPSAKTKWLFNSKLLLGEDRDKLVVLNIKTHHAGEYKCIVSNEYGTVSREFTLGVLVPPFISEFDVLDVQLKEGANATLDCNAKGVPEPNVTWSFDNTNWHITNTSLTSTSVTPKSEGTFRCVALNKVGVAHLVYNVTVVSVARVKSIVVFRNGEGTDLEGSVDVALNSNVRIACEAKGNPKPTIQWFKHGNKISQNDKGATYADLTFDSVAITQAGTYVCIAVNEGGMDERQLKINVLEPPTIFKTLFRNDNTTDSPIKLEVMSDQSFFMHCHAYGYPMPDIYWFKDGLPLRLFDDSMVSKEYGEIIAVNRASEEHSGNYTCVARNGVGETSVIYLIDVLVAPPQQKDNTKHVNLLFGKPLNLTCPVEGKPLPYVMWVKHPYTEIAETERIHLINDNYTLLINDTEVLDTGKYSCIMTNKVGSTEIIYDVIIEKPPSIARNMGNNITERHVVPLRRSIVLKCEVDGNPPPKISWLKDIQKLSDNLPNVQNVQGHSVLAVWSANTRDAGRYICVAENAAGTAHRVYELVVRVPGKWSAWSGWGYCNATCGRGVQVRSRICQHIDDSNHTYDKSSQTDKIILDESACKGSSVEQRKCQMPPCEESISEWSHWSRWSVCSATCGAATQARTRRCRVRDCSGDNVQIRRCRGLPPCPTPKRQRLENDVFSSADNEHNGLTDFLPEATFEIGPDIEQQYNSQPSNDEFDDYYTAPTSSMPTYYDVNVTENLDGSERGPCDPGFKHNAEENICIDVDECHLPLNLCHSTQVCANRVGGYRCACPRGYRAAGPNARCLDINECALNISGCEFACVNVAGGHVCACPNHLRLHADRHHCVPPSKYNKPRYSYEDMDTEDYLSTSIDYPAR